MDVSQQYCENFRKIEQAELVENLPPSYLPFEFLHNFHSFLLWEKVKILDVLKTIDYNKTFCTQVVTTNSFALNHDKSLQIYFFCLKRQAKNDFLKDVESIVVLVNIPVYINFEPNSIICPRDIQRKRNSDVNQGP